MADDVEQILQEVYQPEPPTPMEAPKEAPKVEAQFSKTLKVRGKEHVIEDENEFLSLAQKGLDYDLNNRLLRQERELFEQTKTKYPEADPEKLRQLKEWNDYLEAHPDIAKKISENIQSFQQSNETQPLMNEISALKAELNPIKDGWKAFQMEQHDKALDTDILSLKKTIPEYPWDTADENGFTGEHRLLNHFLDKNFHSMKAALYDLYGDQLLERRVQKAKEDLTNEIKSRDKKGLIVSERLMKSNSMMPSKDVKNSSYDDIFKNVLKEYNIGG